MKDNLKAGESPERQWFALVRSGQLMPIGDCGDHEAADEIATDLDYNTVWLISPVLARDWVNALASRGITAESNDE